MSSYQTIPGSFASTSCTSNASYSSTRSAGPMPTSIQIGFNTGSSHRLPKNPSSLYSGSAQWSSAYGSSHGLFISDEELLDDFDDESINDHSSQQSEDATIERPTAADITSRSASLSIPPPPPSTPVHNVHTKPRIRVAAKRKTNPKPRRASRQMGIMAPIPEKRGT